MFTVAEGIRLGAMTRPTQAFGYYSYGGDDSGCAMTALMDAHGFKVFHGYWKELFLAHPILQDTRTCPDCGFVGALCQVITHLNDEHRFTREQIADRVAVLESLKTKVKAKTAVGEAVADVVAVCA